MSDKLNSESLLSRLYTFKMHRSSLLCLVLILFVFIRVNAGSQSKGWKISDRLKENPRLGEFVYMLTQFSAWEYVDHDDVTMFLPTSVLTFNTESTIFNKSADLKNYILQNTVRGVVKENELSDGTILRSLSEDRSRLFVNRNTNFIQNVLKGVIFVNGGKIVEPSMRCENGVVFIVDRVNYALTPMKSVFGLLQSGLYMNDTRRGSLGALLQNYSRQRDIDDIVQSLNSSQTTLTLFLPDDAIAVDKLAYGLETKSGSITNTIKSHVVMGSAAFIHAHLNKTYQMSALYGSVSVIRNENTWYVKNGLSIAKILSTNHIALNGVIHVLDRVLSHKNENLTYLLSRLPNTRFVKYFLPQFTDDIKRTYFIPTDNALSKLPASQQMRLDVNSFLRAITLPKEINMSTMTTNRHVRNLNGDLIKVHVISNGQTWLIYGNIKLRIILSDLGCEQGTVHLVDTVLAPATGSVTDTWVRLSGGESFMATLLTKHPGVLSKLSYPTMPHTMFLPSLTALEGVSHDVLQGYLNDSSKGRRLLMDHIVSGSWDTSQLLPAASTVLTTLSSKRITMSFKNDVIRVTTGYVTTAMSLPNIWCRNGVIHTVDAFLFAPMRNMVAEISRRENLQLGNEITQTAYPLYRKLNGEGNAKDSVFTVFMPTNLALSQLPSNFLTGNEAGGSLEQLLKYISRYVVEGAVVYAENVTHTPQTYASMNGHVTLVKINQQTWVSSSGVWARIVQSDIRVTNGVLHVLDGPLSVYRSVGREIETNDHFRYFMDLFWSSDHLSDLYGQKKVTLFIPDQRFVDNETRRYLRNNRDIANEVLRRHIVLNTTLDWSLMLSQSLNPPSRDSAAVWFNQSRTYTRAGPMLSWNNVSIAVTWRNITCTNGVIHIVTGLLHDVIESGHVESSTGQNYTAETSTGLDTGYRPVSRTPSCFNTRFTWLCVIVNVVIFVR